MPVGRRACRARLYWLSPKGDVYGPTRLQIDVRSKGNPRETPTLLTLQGEHFQSGDGWDRYFEVVQENWKETLESLKQWCESEAPKQPDSRIMAIGDSYLAEAVLKKTGVRKGYCLELGCGDGARTRSAPPIPDSPSRPPRWSARVR